MQLITIGINNKMQAIRYQIRSLALLSIVNEIKAKRLVPDAYFQRNLVWRDVHKRDFIETILLGYPFPQIFFSRGKIDVKKMSSTACIVDGQQRMNAIMEFIEGRLVVKGKRFSNLTEDEKSRFLKYEIGVVELDMDNDDPKVKEIFKRVNRTANSLTAIEKLASEYGATELMLTGKLLAGDLGFLDEETDEAMKRLKIDPSIEPDQLAWLKKQKVSDYQALIFNGSVFTPQEITRKVPLMYTLNLISTLTVGFFNRNDKTLQLLDDFREELANKDQLVSLFVKTAKSISKLHFSPDSMWNNKANFFSLFVRVALNGGALTSVARARAALAKFQENPPDDYALAAREAVNNKAQREARDKYVQKLLG